MGGGIKTVNLEQGMPTRDQAVRRLTYEIQSAKAARLAGLKLIHGYGSSGTGGAIRLEVRQYLGRQRARGAIRLFVPGESFSIFDADSRAALEACGQLRLDRDLDRHNNGITIVIL